MELVVNGKKASVVKRSLAAVRWWMRRLRVLKLAGQVEPESLEIAAPAVPEKAIRRLVEEDPHLRSASTKRLYRKDTQHFETWRQGRTNQSRSNCSRLTHQHCKVNGHLNPQFLSL